MRAWLVLTAAVAVFAAAAGSAALADAREPSAPTGPSAKRARGAVPGPASSRATAPVPQPDAALRLGLRCPDGTVLPLLNGVLEAPPITRSAHLGPLPPVVGTMADATGCEWYVHQDGSVTTTRRRRAWVDGVPVTNVETVHNARLPDAAARVRSRLK
ncbi:MAG: hypothetical protein AAF628_30465 [Planctomycetota bacterium]